MVLASPALRPGPLDVIGERSASRHHNRGICRDAVFEFGEIGWLGEEIVIEEHNNIKLLGGVENCIALRG